MHADTKKPYEWKYGDELVAHWRNPPPIPSNLFSLWRAEAEPIAARPSASGFHARHAHDSAR
jgi:hypothetical protein